MDNTVLINNSKERVVTGIQAGKMVFVIMESISGISLGQKDRNVFFITEIRWMATALRAV
jgi:hypothetical protein